MIEQLPRWVWWAGGLLAFAAGLMNVVGLLSFGGEAVTHLTGTTTLFAGHVSHARWQSALHLAAIFGAFFAGAVASGWLIRNEHLKLGRRYTVALLLETGLVLAALAAFLHRNPAAYYLLAGAVGLQNAMASTYSGAVIRTSHVTGMVTDLGIYLGHALRGLPVHRKRLAVSLLVTSTFLAGGLVGGLGLRWAGEWILLLPAAIALALALAHEGWRRSHRGSGGRR